MVKISKRIDESVCQYCGAKLFRQPFYKVLKETDVYKENIHNQEVLCCQRFPECDTYLIISTEKDFGIPGNRFLRLLRKRAHLIFDMIHLSGIEKTEILYDLMGTQLHKQGKYSHIRYFDVYDCIDSILFSIGYLSKNYHKAKTLRYFSKNKLELFDRISNMDININRTDYSSQELLPLLQIIFNDYEKTVVKVNKRTGTCTFRFRGTLKKHYGESASFFFNSRHTIQTAIYSLTKSTYDKYSERSGFPPLPPMY